MKIRVYLKDPDGFYEGVNDACSASLKEMALTDKERDRLLDTRVEETWEKLDKWVSDQEYVELEFDTETGTAIVVAKL